MARVRSVGSSQSQFCGPIHGVRDEGRDLTVNDLSGMPCRFCGQFLGIHQGMRVGHRQLPEVSRIDVRYFGYVRIECVRRTDRLVERSGGTEVDATDIVHRVVLRTK